MEVHLTPEQEARLTVVAANSGTDTERLVKDTVLRLIEIDSGVRTAPPGSIVAEMRA